MVLGHNSTSKRRQVVAVVVKGVKWRWWRVLGGGNDRGSRATTIVDSVRL